MPRCRTRLAASAAAGAVALGTYRWLRGGASGPPDYGDAGTWFAYEHTGGKRADLFYAHPTTQAGVARWNMAWEDAGATCTGPVAGDPDLLLGQAAAWSEEANLYAPKYRQMGFLAQGMDLETTDKHHANVKASLDMAAGDLERAFRHFLQHRPDKSRPFVVAAHSQGAILMTRVLATQLQGTEHEDKLVAAYLCGAYCPQDLFGTVFTTIRACAGPTDTRCLISYDTRTPEFKPESLNHIAPALGIGLWGHHLHWLLHDRYCERPRGTDDVGKPRLQINPGTWTAAGGGQHLGALLTSTMVKPPAGYSAGGRLLPPAGWAAKTTVNDYSVSVEDPDKWWPGSGRHGNLHAIDVQFWFYNHRENVKQRLAEWFQRRAA